MIDIEYQTLLAMVEHAIRQNSQFAINMLIEQLKAGAVPQSAIRDALRSFEGPYYETLASAYSQVLGTDFGVQQIKALPVSGLALSTHLYGFQSNLNNEIVGIITRHAKGMQDSRKLALDIYEGYGFKANETLNLDPKNHKLPKYMRELVADQDLKSQMQRLIARGQADTLKTQSMRAAYVQAIDAMEKGAGMDRLNRVLDVAFNERMRYFANRIAQTELHRAHSDKTAREFMEDEELTVVQVRMSSTHPKTDICDLHSRIDKYGLGPGCYPKALAPKPGFHPFCRCQIIGRWDLDGTKAKERKKAEQAFLIAAGEKDGMQIMGSRERWFKAKHGQASIADIYNGHKDPMYHIQTVGQVGGRIGGMDKQTPIPPNQITKPTFQDQKTAKAAAEWAMKNNIADFADYAGVKPEVANAWNKSLFDHLQEFPMLRNAQKFVGTCQAQFARWREIEIQRYIGRLQSANPHLPGMDFRPHAEKYVKAKKVGNQYAHAWKQDEVGGVAVNKKFGADTDGFEKSVSRSAANGHFPPSNTTIKSVADHEMGHMLDYHLDLRLDIDIVQAYKEATNKGMKKEVSAYAATNIQEFIAECWAESCNSNSPRPFAKKISDIVRARYRAKHP